MSWEFFIRNFSHELSLFLKASGDRWSTAAEKVSKGTYTSSELQTDMVDSFQGVIALWTTMLTFGPVPTATKTIRQADLVAGDVHLKFVVEKPITTGTLTVGASDEIVLVTDTSKKLSSWAVVTGALNDEIEVTVDKVSSNPDVGVYNARVYLDGSEIIGFVFLTVTL